MNEKQINKMEQIIKNTKNNKILIRYYSSIGENEKAKKLQQEIFNTLIEKGHYFDCLDFAKKQNMSKSDLSIIYNKIYDYLLNSKLKHSKKGALEYAKEGDLDNDKIIEAAKHYFNEIIQEPYEDSNIAIQLATNELKTQPEFLKIALNDSYEKKLRIEDYSGLIELVTKYPGYFDTDRKNLASLLA